MPCKAEKTEPIWGGCDPNADRGIADNKGDLTFNGNQTAAVLTIICWNLQAGENSRTAVHR